MGYIFYNMNYILLFVCMAISVIASSNVNRKFEKYSHVGNRRRISGAETARRILNQNGLGHVAIEITEGRLSDHYDPRKKVLRLSQDVYNNQSIASISVAAHEVGHALQHAEGYFPLKFRNAIVPVVNITSTLAMPLIMIGIMLEVAGNFTSGTLMFDIGVLFFVVVILFHLITLPVEFNASSRALMAMEEMGIIYPEEKGGAKSVLGAAALTYVAALAVAVLQLLRLLMIRGRK